MIWIIGTLTLILVLTSILLILLILVQLPKKEAGMGTAFGGGTTDALFGAGAGNMLTKLTKYCTIIFFVITMSLSVLNARQSRSKESILERNMQLMEKQEVQENLAAPVTPTTPDPSAPVVVTNNVETPGSTATGNPNALLVTPPPTETPATPGTPATPAPDATPPPPPPAEPENN